MSAKAHLLFERIQELEEQIVCFGKRGEDVSQLEEEASELRKQLDACNEALADKGNVLKG